MSTALGKSLLSFMSDYNVGNIRVWVGRRVRCLVGWKARRSSKGKHDEGEG